MKLCLFFLLLFSMSFIPMREIDDERFITKVVDLKTEELKLYWKNDKGEIMKNFENLSSFLETKNKRLVFAMNAGMFKKDFSPQGLYIEDNQVLNSLDTTSGSGNFYLKPNGVFYITNQNHANITRTNDFVNNKQIKYATQSGPMLLIDGNINAVFKEGSTNLHIRNGVGILPDGKVVFAMSKDKINFYDFAAYFQRLNCKNALYLDGFVSRVYLPEKDWVQKDESFGVMIGIAKDKKK